MIPRADGSQRPLITLYLEDKVIEQAMVYVLEAIYEPRVSRLFVWVPTARQHYAFLADMAERLKTFALILHLKLEIAREKVAPPLMATMPTRSTWLVWDVVALL